MTNRTEEQRERAEAKFERLQRMAEEGRVAMAEYKAAALAMREKTERLRALRLKTETEPVAAAPARSDRMVARKVPKSPPKQVKKRAKAH